MLIGVKHGVMGNKFFGLIQLELNLQKMICGYIVAVETNSQPLS